jgi:TolB-like protein
MPALPRQVPEGGEPDISPEYRASLAVLPFRTLQKNQENAYFAEGIVDDIIYALGGLKDLLVIARSSTQEFARVPLDLRRVGYELDVRYVLHGSVRTSTTKLRITVELCDAASGTVIWTDRVDGQMAELFDLQDHIAIRVATSIAPHLRMRELTRSLRKRPESLTAYDLTLRALDLFYRIDRDSLEQAGTLLRQAIAHDPGYALAYSHIAWLHMARIGQGWSENETSDREAAATAARLALDRNRNDALALAMCGHVQSYLLKNFETARGLLDRALTAGPSCAWAWSLSALTHAYIGNLAEAIEHAQRAVRLAPIGIDSYWFEHFLSIAYYFDKRYEDAVAWGRLSHSHARSNSSNLRVLAAALVGSGDLQNARAVIQQLLALDPLHSLARIRVRTPFLGKIQDRFLEHLRLAGLPE